VCVCVCHVSNILPSRICIRIIARARTHIHYSASQFPIFHADYNCCVHTDTPTPNNLTTLCSQSLLSQSIFQRESGWGWLRLWGRGSEIEKHPASRKELQGKGMQQSPTSERAYQRVILLVDAVVATSRRHWSIHDPGVATFIWRGCSIPGNDYQKATRGSRDGRNPAWRRPSNL